MGDIPEIQRRIHEELQQIEGIVDYFLFPRLHDRFSYRLVQVEGGNAALVVIKE